MKAENIDVAVRLRPLTTQEIANYEKKVINLTSNAVNFCLDEIPKYSTASLNASKSITNNKQFEFKNCFSETTENSKIYSKVIEPLIQTALKGINATVFLYGQTGSGKTHTMTGDYVEKVDHRDSSSKSPSRYRDSNKIERENNPHFANDKFSSSKSKEILRKSINGKQNFCSNQISKALKPKSSTITLTECVDKSVTDQGILQIAIREIFERQSLEISQKRLKIKCSYLEIYNENVYDLLRETDQLEMPLTIYEDINKAEFLVKNAVEKQIQDLSQSISILNLGEKNRHFAETKLNHHSSRSHTIFRLFIQKETKDMQILESMFNFVDLAGSEKISKYDKEETLTAKSNRIQESKSINKSLFFLTTIINAKANSKGDVFVPYRNSPLTKILKNSIGGNAKTLIILCITPSFSDFEQTLSTLRFGNLAKMIINTVSINKVDNKVNYEGNDVMKELILKCNKQILSLNSVYNEGKITYDNYKARITELENQKLFLIGKNKEKLMDLKNNFTNEAKPEICDFYLSNCGVIFYYSTKHANKKVHQSSKMGSNFNTNLQMYTKEILEDDIVRAKQTRIDELLANNKAMKLELISKNKIMSTFESENKVLRRIVDFMTNASQKDYQFASNECLESVIQSSLTLIENCKTETINRRIASNFGESVHLSFTSSDSYFKENWEEFKKKISGEKNIDLKTNIEALKSNNKSRITLIENTDVINKESAFGVIELKAQTPNKQAENQDLGDQLCLSEIFENIEIIPPALKKNKLISSGFLLRD